MKFPVPLFLAASSAWAVPPLLSEAHMMALQEEPPYAEAMEEGGEDLPSTASNIAAVPPLIRQQQQNALKRVLLNREIRARNESRRMSSGNMRTCAQEAQQLGAPKSAVRLFQRLSDESQSRRQHAASLRALESLILLYRIDEPAVHYYVRSSNLTTEELRQITPLLPIEALFNSYTEPGNDRKAADRREYATAIARMASLCQRIHDTASAEETADQLLSQLISNETTSATRLYDALQLQHGVLPTGYLPPPADVLQQWAVQQQRLKAASYYGSLRLHAFLELLD